MQDLAVDGLPFVGAAELEATATGVVPHRLPAWARVQVTEPLFGLVEAIPAGVRLRMHTDATSLELDVNLTVLQIADREPVPATFDLVVDGERRETVSSIDGTRLVLSPGGGVQFVPGDLATLSFALPGDAAAIVEVWLPHAAGVAIAAARVSDGATVSAAPTSGKKWIHYGSSISHCLEAARPTETWPNAVAIRAGLDLRNLGLGGQCMLDQFAARTIREAPADVITMKVGINVVNGATMRERTFVPALHGFLDTVREGHPHTPILLLSPIICPTAEEAPGPTLPQENGTYATVEQPKDLTTGSLTLRRIRELVETVVAVRDDPQLSALSGLVLFGEDDVADLYDGLHPNAAGYLRMADRFYDAVFAPEGLLGSVV